jgi:NADH:ubiquinone oxidoreductase subunit 6 (subunit J)
MTAVLSEQLQSGSFWYVLAFGCCAAGVLIPGLLVVTSRNILHSALWLLPCLASVAGLFLLLGAELLAAIQILVYCGGIVVLVLFAVMLTHGLGHADVRVSNQQLLWGSIGAAALAGVVLHVLNRQMWPPGSPLAPGDVTDRLADALLSPYVLAFEVASIVLLVAMVGAIVIARAEPE